MLWQDLSRARSVYVNLIIGTRTPRIQVRFILLLCRCLNEAWQDEVLEGLFENFLKVM